MWKKTGPEAFFFFAVAVVGVREREWVRVYVCVKQNANLGREKKKTTSLSRCNTITCLLFSHFAK